MRGFFFRGRSYYLKQTALFLLTVLVPSTALVLLSLRMMAQERELAENRSRERREDLGRQFGASLARNLHGLRESLSPVAASSEANDDIDFTMVFFLEENQVLLPWERQVRTNSTLISEDASFTQHISAGQK